MKFINNIRKYCHSVGFYVQRVHDGSGDYDDDI